MHFGAEILKYIFIIGSKYLKSGIKERKYRVHVGTVLYRVI